MSHRVDPGFGGERALGDKCALPSSLYTGVRYKPLLTGGMALLAGGAMPLAFAPVGWAWLAVIALATFFVLTAQSSRRQALWSAYLFGLGYFGVGVSWVFISISQYGNGPVVAVLVTAAFVSLLALFPWGVAYLVRCLRPEMDAMALWLGLPAAWVLSEWMRTWFLTGFPLALHWLQPDRHHTCHYRSRLWRAWREFTGGTSRWRACLGCPGAKPAPCCGSRCRVSRYPRRLATAGS